MVVIAVAATIAVLVAMYAFADRKQTANRPTSAPTNRSRVIATATTRPAFGAAEVVAENRRPGTTAWRLPPGTVTTAIAGYADRVSALRGQTVTLYVSSPSPFHIEAYRMGFYGGAGARLVWISPVTPGVVQPKRLIVAPNRTVEARWTPSLRVPIGPDWTPGDYLFKLVGADVLAQHYIPLTVRDDTSAAAIVVVNAVTTWQAYNQWGGYSLYKGPRADPKLRSNIVSFDRPYDNSGASEFLGNEYPLVSLTEQLGLDVTYLTSVDVAAHPETMLHHRAIISLGHDEYWSLAMRNGVEAARDHGVNVAFLGANAVFRRIRLESSALGPMRHEVNYRSARLDPMTGKDNAEVTTSWRERPAARPESTLTGVLYECNPVDVNGVVADASSWVFAGSGLKNGDQIPGLIGSEYDRVTPQSPTPSTIQVLFHSPLTCRKKKSFSDAAYYTAPSGAGVFSTGTGAWICKLLTGCPADRPMLPDSRIRVITTNVLRAFAAGPAGIAHPSNPNLVTLHITTKPLGANSQQPWSHTGGTPPPPD